MPSLRDVLGFAAAAGLNRSLSLTICTWLPAARPAALMLPAVPWKGGQGGQQRRSGEKGFSTVSNTASCHENEGMQLVIIMRCRHNLRASGACCACIDGGTVANCNCTARPRAQLVLE
jgi:hypothetical protein